jgi:hypothetical protein
LLPASPGVFVHSETTAYDRKARRLTRWCDVGAYLLLRDPNMNDERHDPKGRRTPACSFRSSAKSASNSEMEYDLHR